MRTLLGLFRTRAAALSATERLRDAGFTVRSIDSSFHAGELAEATNEGAKSAAASGSALGALTGGLVGAAPAALVGKAFGRWLADREGRTYEDAIAAGGVALVVEAPEVAPAARAEQMLRESGAEHVQTGEVPHPS
jgi:hypothetical protein